MSGAAVRTLALAIGLFPTLLIAGCGQPAVPPERGREGVPNATGQVVRPETVEVVESP
ncbi:hypothetical protein [Tautonia sociabilis]|uniref:hypothetical protein n=1 Tax=Tautonia sociabilis TaxID=2080755 RepID=UPI0013159EC8|nr:hypothetical protein [Tautonia sociabilis]